MLKSFSIALVATVLASIPASAATPKQQTFSTLKNAAIAEENYAVSASEYTESVKQLRQEGLQYNADAIKLFVSWANKVGYCLQARHEKMDKPFHYDYSEGEPLSGPCPSSTQAKRRWRQQMSNVLKNAATAEESYRTTAGTYTDDKQLLRAEGWKNPWAEIRVRIVWATDTYFCIEADHRGLDTPTSYDSTVGTPNHGTSCPS